MGSGRDRRGQDDEITLLESKVQVIEPVNDFGQVASLLWTLAHGDDAHADRAGEFGKISSDCTETDDDEGGVAEVARARRLSADFLLRPVPLGLEFCGFRQTFGHSKDKS